MLCPSLLVRSYLSDVPVSHFRKCAPCEDLNQPAVPRSLIRIFTVHIWDSQGFQASSYGQRRLWSHSRFAGWLECSLCVNVRRFPRAATNTCIYLIDIQSGWPILSTDWHQKHGLAWVSFLQYSHVKDSSQHQSGRRHLSVVENLYHYNPASHCNDWNDTVSGYNDLSFCNVAVQINIMKTRLFKYTENFTTKN